jgi:hypothetical protein
LRRSHEEGGGIINHESFSAVMAALSMGIFLHPEYTYKEPLRAAALLEVWSGFLRRRYY